VIKNNPDVKPVVDGDKVTPPPAGATDGEVTGSGESVGCDPALAALLEQLWRAATSSPDKPWSLAKLSKQSQLQMSTLRRWLTDLVAADLVEVTINEDGSGSAALNARGRELCGALFS
jgi:hypothetical protein